MHFYNISKRKKKWYARSCDIENIVHLKSSVPAPFIADIQLHNSTLQTSSENQISCLINIIQTNIGCVIYIQFTNILKKKKKKTYKQMFHYSGGFRFLFSLHFEIMKYYFLKTMFSIVIIIFQHYIIKSFNYISFHFSKHQVYFKFKYKIHRFMKKIVIVDSLVCLFLLI